MSISKIPLLKIKELLKEVPKISDKHFDNMNALVRLPSYKSSRKLIERLFGNPKLLPIPEFKDNRPKYRSVRKKVKSLESIETKEICIPTPTIINKIHKTSPRQRRIEREFMAEGQFTPEEWLAIKWEYDNSCLRCGTKGVQIVPDHVWPLYRNGKNSIDNIQPLCNKCNFWKGLKIIDYRPGFAFEIL